jgi:hypothetical protein
MTAYQNGIGPATGAHYAVSTPSGDRVTFALPTGHAIPVHPFIAQLDFEAQKAYAQAFADAWAEALNAQGEAAFVSSKNSAAIHEAGHVVIATLDGFSIDAARIWRPKQQSVFGGGWVGYTDAAADQGVSISPDTDPDVILRMARQTMAGYIAERVFEGEDAREGSSIDERITSMVLAMMAADGAGRDAEEVILETEKNVARMLVEHKEQHRKISVANAKAAPLKLKGKRLDDLTAMLPCN